MRISGLNVSPVLLDLDNTLVDRDRAISQLGSMLFRECHPLRAGLSEQCFVNAVVEIDAGGSIPDKRQQMERAISRSMTERTSADELEIWWDRNYPRVFVLKDSVIRVLKVLSSAGISWGIVSNGSPLQEDVVQSVGLDQMTETVIISSLVNIGKPDRAIFELAASKVGIGVELSQILFVGDNPSADIVGTQTAGMKTAWISGGREWSLADASPDFIVETVADLARLMA